MTELSRADKHKVVNGVISSCGTAALSEVESRALRRGSRKSQGGKLNASTHSLCFLHPQHGIGDFAEHLLCFFGKKFPSEQQTQQLPRKEPLLILWPSISERACQGDVY